MKDAINTLIDALESDESYCYGWQANIAVQFQDAWQRAVDSGGLPPTPEQIHAISNEAAKAFLSVLCYRPAVEPANER